MDDLERTLSLYLERLAKGGCWRDLQPAHIRDLDIATAPLVLIGAGSVISQPLVRHAVKHFNVLGQVDNARAGQMAEDTTILGDSGLSALIAKEPNLVGVMCCCSDGAVDHFTRLWQPSGRPLLSLFQALRLAGLPAADEFADPSAIAALLDRRDIWRAFTDQASRDAFLSLLLHRLTWERAWLEPQRLSYKSMYFSTDALALGEDEVLVDGGGYDGDTVLDFVARTNGSHGHIHTFEVDPANLSALRDRVAAVPRVSIHAMGLWDCAGVLKLAAGQGACSALGGEGDLEVPVRALDSLELGRVSFIKLDIEGAEAQALRGAADTIRRHKPKLAIAAYHLPDDLIGLVDTIRAIRPDYRFRLRHHSPIFHDSVLYAD